MVRWGGILLAFELAALIFFIAGTHGKIVKLDRPVTTDFVSFYAAGVLSTGSEPARAYSQPEHYAAEQAATECGIEYNFFFYPPVFLLLCSLLAKMPYLVAFIAFEAISCSLYVFVVREVLQERGWGWVLTLMAFPSVLWTIGLGQNSFVTAALFGAATLLLETRPILSGAIFGMLCYKPHFGLLIPIALGAGRYGKAFLAASVSVILLVGLSGLCFGWDTWRAFLTAFASSSAVFASGRIPFAGLISVFGAARLIGLPAEAAWIIQSIMTLGSAAIVALIWFRASSPAVKFASLAAATLLAIPVVLMYDFVLLSVGGCWLIRAGRRTGFLCWEKSILFVAFLVPIVSRSIGASLDIPIGPFAAIGLLLVCLRRAHSEAPLAQIW